MDMLKTLLPPEVLSTALNIMSRAELRGNEAYTYVEVCERVKQAIQVQTVESEDAGNGEAADESGTEGAPAE